MRHAYENLVTKILGQAYADVKLASKLIGTSKTGNSWSAYSLVNDVKKFLRNEEWVGVLCDFIETPVDPYMARMTQAIEQYDKSARVKKAEAEKETTNRDA